LPYSESDTRANYIDPSLVVTGWQPLNIRREYYFTDGRKLFGGKRGQRCFVDYLLIHNKAFLGIIEAKSEDKEQKFYNWSERKGQYKQEQLLSALEWMKKNDIAPFGFGKEIKKAKKYV
jgi:type I site-specific restriction endonuclease